MATYTDIYKNLGVKLVVNQTSQNIANNTSVVSWYIYAYKISTHNPWNNLGTTPFKATINGTVVYNSNASYDLRGSTTQQLISSGTSTITHTADGTKSIAVEGYANYTSTGYGYGAVTAKGSLSLTSIPRVSIATLSTASFNFGQSVTLTTNRSSSSFTHSVFYVIGSTEYSLATGVGASTTIAIPNSVMSSYPAAESASMVIRTKTLSGATQIGISNISVTVNVPSTIIPTIGSVAPLDTVAAANIFTANDEQYIRGLSKLKATAGSVAGSNGSTIKSYHYRIVDANGAVVTGTETSSTSSSHTYGTFSFPTKAQVSAVYKVQCRVLDSRNRYSSWRDSKVFRVHYYEAPTINLTGVTRSGTGNTSIIGNRTYNVYSLKEGGTTEKNTGTFVVKYREKGVTAWTAATGGATGLSLSNSSATFVTGAATSKFYEIQATVTDKIGSAFSSIISVGSEFVTMEILRGKAVGIGIAPIAGGRDLYVGTGGVYSYGAINSEGNIKGSTIDSNGAIRSNGIAIEQGRHSNFKTFTVGGTANNYYPVIISSQATFGFNRYSISRAYNAPAPNTWNTATHRGGLTFDFEWTGDNSWGGNDKSFRVIQWGETYTTMVGGIQLGYSGGLIVWLRGGGAEYRLASERGVYAGVEVRLTGFTDANNINYPVRSSPVASEINSSYPVRNNGTLYEYGHRVITTNTISNYVTNSGSTANGSWYQVGELQICAQNLSIAGLYSAYTLTGTWTYPKSFTGNPIISATPRANLTDPAEIMNGTLSVLGTPSSTSVEFSWMRQTGANFTSSSRKYLTVFAIGQV